MQKWHSTKPAHFAEKNMSIIPASCHARLKVPKREKFNIRKTSMGDIKKIRLTETVTGAG